MDPETFRISADCENACETVCDEVVVEEPFVTIKSADRNTIFVQSSDVLLMREYTVELPSGTMPPRSEGS